MNSNTPVVIAEEERQPQPVNRTQENLRRFRQANREVSCAACGVKLRNHTLRQLQSCKG